MVKRTLFDTAGSGMDKDYEWLKLNVFTRWNASTKEGTVIVFDANPDIRTRLKELMCSVISPICVEHPGGLHIPFAQLTVDLQNDAVWNIRTAVREVERSRTSHHLQFSRLHDLARHAIHVIETLETAARTLHNMIEHHEQVSATFATSSTATDDDVNKIRIIDSAQQQIHNQLCFYKEAIQGLRVRSISNRDRLQNEMQLSFNVVAQKIANSSVEIHRAIRSDSSIMRAVALATAAFVPMTFVATVFSMSFFDFTINNGGWTVSDKLWIYWGWAVPFTCVIGFLTYLYHYLTALRGPTVAEI